MFDMIFFSKSLVSQVNEECLADDPFRILKLEWQDALSLAESQTYTVEEQLLRERMRTSAVGITEFLTNPE